MIDRYKEQEDQRKRLGTPVVIQTADLARLREIERLGRGLETVGGDRSVTWDGFVGDEFGRHCLWCGADSTDYFDALDHDATCPWPLFVAALASGRPVGE